MNTFLVKQGAVPLWPWRGTLHDCRIMLTGDESAAVGGSSLAALGTDEPRGGAGLLLRGEEASFRHTPQPTTSVAHTSWVQVKKERTSVRAHAYVRNLAKEG